MTNSQPITALLPHHAELLTASAIAPEVIQARGYRSVTTRTDLKGCGFSDGQARVPALLIPIHNVMGETVLYQLRPDDPRVKDGKRLKYETPLKSRMALDVPPPCRAQTRDPGAPLLITEGVRKADAAASRGLCCVALLGVWNWRGRNEDGGKLALGDWESIALNERQTYIVFDSDVMLKVEVHAALGRLKAFLESRGAKVALVYLPPQEDGSKVGLDDYLAAGHSTDALLALATPKLRDLPTDAPAKPTEPGQGRALDLADPEPWLEPVDGAALLEDMAALFGRFLVLPDGAAELCALWCLHTFSMDAWESTGYLGIVSAVKGCGKTTGLTLVRLLSRRGLPADSITPAALFRVIETYSPTLVLDELDGVDPQSDVWTILNSGHRRNGAALRTVGDDHVPRSFATYCAKALGYIRGTKSPVRDTVEDRTLLITLPRKRKDERRDKLRTRAVESLCAPVRSRCMRWSVDHGQALAMAHPEAPATLDDRGADCWEPLLAIADEVGGRWPDLARDLAVRLSGERREEESESINVMLLDDIGALLEAGTLAPDRHGLAAEEMVRLLRGVSGRPWATWGRDGQGITPHALARLLRPFGVRPRSRSGEARRYDPAEVAAVVGRFGTKRQSVIQPPEHGASGSPVSDRRYDASEASSGVIPGPAQVSDPATEEEVLA
jgi:hypothetical protein